MCKQLCIEKPEIHKKLTNIDIHKIKVIHWCVCNPKTENEMYRITHVVTADSSLYEQLYKTPNFNNIFNFINKLKEEYGIILEAHTLPTIENDDLAQVFSVK